MTVTIVTGSSTGGLVRARGKRRGVEKKEEKEEAEKKKKLNRSIGIKKEMVMMWRSRKGVEDEEE